MSTLFGWLKNRNEENILNKAVAHMQKTLECVVEFDKGFTFMVKEHNFTLALDVFRRVDVIEHEADIMRRDILKSITKTEITPEIREDLSDLIKRTDKIANAANAAARRLIALKEDQIYVLSQEILEKMLEIIHVSVEATKILLNLFKKLPELAPKDVLQHTEQIQVLEHKCDVLHMEVCAMFNELTDITINPFTAIQISVISDILEEITDKVEEVGDYIELIKIAKS
jgi:hypothetical protein